MNPLDYLTGYKTYIAALGLALLGVVDLLNGNQTDAATKFAQALGLAGLRKAVDNGRN